MNKKLRIGFAGAGFMGQVAHLSNYALLEDCELTALAEPRQKMAIEVARRHGIREVFRDHLEMLEKGRLDAIVATQPYSNHINVVPDILRAKIPLLTEKPIAVYPESGEMLASLAEDNRVLYMVGYHKRSDPAMEYARALIDEWKASKEYGRMRMVRITMPPGNWLGGVTGTDTISSDEPYPPFREEEMPDSFPAGVADEYNAFVNYYIHQINAMRFLLGEPYKVRYAEKTGVLMVAESEGGVCGALEMAPYSTTRDWQEVMLVSFEHAYVKVELPAPLACMQAGTVTVMRDNGKGIPTVTRPILPGLSAMRRQAANFLAAVRGDRPAPCTASEASEDLRMARDYIFLKNGL